MPVGLNQFDRPRCLNGMTWESGTDLFATSSFRMYLDVDDAVDGNCQGGVNDDADDGIIAPCSDEWRFFNLQGDGKPALSTSFHMLD